MSRISRAPSLHELPSQSVAGLAYPPASALPKELRTYLLPTRGICTASMAGGRAKGGQREKRQKSPKAALSRLTGGQDKSAVKGTCSSCGSCGSRTFKSTRQPYAHRAECALCSTLASRHTTSAKLRHPDLPCPKPATFEKPTRLARAARTEHNRHLSSELRAST